MTGNTIQIRQDHHICGTFGDVFNTRDIYRFGLHVGGRIAQSTQKRIVVATDRRGLNRTHVHLAIGGLQGADCDVTYIGAAPYPMLTYASRTLGIPHALMMTSGESDDTTVGFRLTVDSEPLVSYAIKELFEESRTGDFENASGNGRLAEIDLRPGYLRWLMHGTRPPRDISVLWDARNGAAADVVTSLAAMLPGRHVVVNQGEAAQMKYTDVESAASELGEEVVGGGFSLGIAFNGDASGLVMVDELGQPLREWHRLHILSTRRGRQPIAGNGLLASRRKAKSDIVKHALKVVQAVAEAGGAAASLRDEAEREPHALGKGSVRLPAASLAMQDTYDAKRHS